jgi:Transmembrane amino acid transporter protein
VFTHTAALPFITGVFLYCFEGMGMVLSLEAGARHKASFVPTLTAVVTLYATLCALMGALGYLAFGEATQDIVLLNMGNTPHTLIVKVRPSLDRTLGLQLKWWHDVCLAFGEATQDIVLLNMGNSPHTLIVKVRLSLIWIGRLVVMTW